MLDRRTSFEVPKPSRIYCVSINRPGDLWPWNCCELSPMGWTTFIPILTFLGRFVAYRPTPVRRITWPCDLDHWPFRSRRLSVMRVFVLRLYTKFEVRRLFRSEDMMHFQFQHYVGLVTLTFAFDLETGANYFPWGGQPSYQFWYF